MTCWHFISTHFLRASFAVIFLVLTSSLRRGSSMVKRIVLCTVSSVCTHASQRGALHSDSSASASADLNTQVTDRCLISETLCATNCTFVLTAKCVRAVRSLIMFDWSATCALFIYSSEPSLNIQDQAPHLVYLTSWVWHSVSVSVSLSNTPSEVSLVYNFNPSWVTPQTEQTTPRSDLPGNRLQTLFFWSFRRHRVFRDEMAKTDKCLVTVSPV